MGDRELKFVWFTSKDSRGTEGTGSSADSQGEQQGLGHLSLFADQRPDQGMGLLQTKRGAKRRLKADNRNGNVVLLFC